MDHDKLKALHDHAIDGRYFEVQSLVHEGIHPDKKNYLGNTPLMMAARHSYKEIVELLINAGADIHCRGDHDWTVLHNAAFGGSSEIVQCLVNKAVALDLKTSNGQTPLMTAVTGSNDRVVKLLIKAGADVHCCDDRGWTLLHYASFWNKTELVQLFLNAGIEINAQTSIGETPLHLAIQYGGIRLADYLLELGADCNLEDNLSESPFSTLISKQRCYDVETIKLCIETIKLCFEKGAYVKSTDYYMMLEDPLQKKVILQDVKLCSKAVINKFNNRDLPLFYKGLVSGQKLPHIDKLKIRDRSGMAKEIEQAVTREIRAKGFCNLSKRFPSVLSILCVESSIKRLNLGLNQKSRIESQDGFKRLGGDTKQKYPHKKMCVE